MKFKLYSKFQPAGDQPKAIKKIITGIKNGYQAQTLLGVTGSGKTFTMAKVIEATNKPTLVISHNKTLAAQLYGEFKNFFPENAVHYFVSYYDYYQPEAYIPQTDTYIEKEATINEEIDRLRHAATQSLINRRDCLIVASVSCIYGIGEKEDYLATSKTFKVGEIIKRNEILRQLINIQYERNDNEFRRGQFRVQGENIDIHLATGEAIVRISLFGDEIEKIYLFNIKPNSKSWLYVLKNSQAQQRLKQITILPAKHFLTPEEKLKIAIKNIELELKERIKELRKQKKFTEAERLERKTNYDLEMIKEVGYCTGIENYSRHLSGRPAGWPPATLIDFFPDDFLVFIDESHVTIPQIQGMYTGDRARKQVLVDFGFRLPSALDNRPLNFQEFNKKIVGKNGKFIYVSATPGKYEIKHSQQVVEQIVRPTGLVDPEIEVRPTENQIPDLIKEIKKKISKDERVLITVLTKRMAEELTEFLLEENIKTAYIHSEIDTLERVEIIRQLRTGEIDVLVGVNLLREGLDMPEVSLVVILDADISGFLRNETSLIQTIGRAARNAQGKVIMYANQISPAMRWAIQETERRRRLQIAYNKKYGITPKTVKSKVQTKII